MRLLAWIYGQRDFPPELFPESADLDARHVATNENEHFVAGNWVAPVEGQDHDIHLGIHESFLAIYQCVGDHDPAVVEKLKAHNQMHEQMKQREAAGMQSAINQTQAQQQMAGMGDAGSPPMTSGEVAGDAMGATGGGMMA
jgi:hypothetical protein